MSIYCHTLCKTYLVLMAGVAGLGVWNRSAAAQDKPGGRASKIEYEGWRQYMVNCARCHGDDAIAGVMAPDLRTSITKGAVDSAAFRTVVATGRREKGMPGFKRVLNDKQIAAIYAYVKARAQKRLPAGRP